jgi:hypothetical protein
LYRDTAPAGFDLVFCTGTNTDRLHVCTSITPASQKVCIMMAKTALCFASFGLRKMPLKTKDPASGLRSTQHRLLMLTAVPLASSWTQKILNPCKKTDTFVWTLNYPLKY